MTPERRLYDGYKCAVMAGLVPAIHDLLRSRKRKRRKRFDRQKDVDGRDKPGHDGLMDQLRTVMQEISERFRVRQAASA
jgi:hypothetical protein